MSSLFRILAVTSISLCTLIPAAPAADERADVIQNSFTAAAGGRIIIQADRGSITVEGGDATGVDVEVTRKAVRGSDKKAAALLKRHEVTFSQDGQTIRVESDLKGDSGWNWRGPNLEVAIRVRVPRAFNLEAATAGGSIDVARLKGDVVIKTSGGSLRLEELSGRVHGRTSGGSIKGNALSGAIDLSTSGGGVTLEGISGERLKAGTSGGSIRLAGITVPAEARTSGGSISVETAATPLEASTSGGSIEATFTAAPTAEVNLKTSGGGINVGLPENAAFQLDASTSAGGVRSEFPVTVTASKAAERSELRGPVNGGGPSVKLRTSAGSIRVRKV